jgi:hypothetical protein
MRMRRLLEVPGLTVDDVRCDGGGRTWSEGERCDDFDLVLVGSGCFRRRVDGRDSVLDPAVLYVQAPGEEQQFAHPRDNGDTCTVVRVDGELPARGEPLYSPPAVDLEHRLPVASSARRPVRRSPATATACASGSRSNVSPPASARSRALRSSSVSPTTRT